jgi:multicomponent Na+:H+ antiporter subunit D
MTIEIILLPILFQVFLAVLLMFFWNAIYVQRLLSMVGSAVALVLAISLFQQVWSHGIITTQAGNWQAPFGITFVADPLSATLVLLTAIAGFGVSVYSAGSIVAARQRFGYFPILHFLLLGLNGAFLTGDIFNLYVWFEIIIISSFVLITLGGEKAQLEGAVNYFTLNMLASVIFLTAIGILYGLVGTLNMADLSGKVAEVQNKALVYVSALLFFVGFGIKSAVFPLYFWLPSSYHTPPPAVAAIFGGLLTKVGVYALLRCFSLIFVDSDFIDQLMLSVAILTMFSGGIGALVQTNIRKVFSYLIICHIGFMIAGLGLFNKLSLTGGVYYLIHDIIVKTNLFMVAGLIFKIKGTNSLKKLGGLYAQYPKLSLLMAIPLFSLVGIPPLSGFWPKISLIMGSFSEENYYILAFLLFASFITLVIIAKVWVMAFWEKGEEVEEIQEFLYFEAMPLYQKIMVVAPIVFLSVVSLYIGFQPENIQVLAERIADQLVDPTPYIRAVLGKP